METHQRGLPASENQTTEQTDSSDETDDADVGDDGEESVDDITHARGFIPPTEDEETVVDMDPDDQDTTRTDSSESGRRNDGTPEHCPYCETVPGADDQSCPNCGAVL